MIIIGIDPGKGGSIAVKSDKTTVAYKMPQTERDLFDRLKEIKEVAGSREIVCYLEKVHAMPGEGVKSVWTFSGNYHSLRMALIALFIPFYDITPMEWQKTLSVRKKNKSVTKTQHKNNLKAKAQQLYPEIKVTLYNADALLLCEYGKGRHIF